LDFSNKYIIGFALALCLVCSLVVSTLAVSLKERQDANKLHDLQLNILRVAGLIEEGGKVTPEEAADLFKDVQTIKVSRETGEAIEEIPFGTLDMFKLAKDKDTSTATTTRAAKDASVSRIPNELVVLKVTAPGNECYVFQFWGNGLWSTMHGYIAVETDLQNVKGLTFVEHGETPGLGGEVDNPSWKSQWPSRQLFNDEGVLAIDVTKKGQVKDPTYQVDGISGSTITSVAVGAMLQTWLGEEGFGPYLAREMEDKS
jgi:Na+-transporting NADH:ubiquinone oxidoreductase subunit C